MPGASAQRLWRAWSRRRLFRATVGDRRSLWNSVQRSLKVDGASIDPHLEQFALVTSTSIARLKKQMDTNTKDITALISKMHVASINNQQAASRERLQLQRSLRRDL